MIPLSRHSAALRDTPLREVFASMRYTSHGEKYVSVHRPGDCPGVVVDSEVWSWSQLVSHDTSASATLIGCVDCGTAGTVIEALDDMTTRFQFLLGEFHTAASRLSPTANGMRTRSTLDATWAFAGGYPWAQHLPSTRHSWQRLTTSGLTGPAGATFLEDSGEFFASLGRSLLSRAPGMQPLSTDAPTVGVVVSGNVAVDTEAELWRYPALTAQWDTRSTFVVFEVDPATAERAVRVAGQWRREQIAVVLDSAAHQLLLAQGHYPAVIKYAVATPDVTAVRLREYAHAVLAAAT